jgi:hypothetical protein
MYHDQALIPLKTLDMGHGMNVTLGLPIIRTSPDHGTAFNIAGADGITIHLREDRRHIRDADPPNAWPIMCPIQDRP